MSEMDRSMAARQLIDKLEGVLRIEKAFRYNVREERFKPHHSYTSQKIVTFWVTEDDWKRASIRSGQVLTVDAGIGDKERMRVEGIMYAEHYKKAKAQDHYEADDLLIRLYRVDNVTHFCLRD